MPSGLVDPVDFFAVYCCFGHVRGGTRGRFDERSYSPVCFIYFLSVASCGSRGMEK